MLWRPPVDVTEGMPPPVASVSRLVPVGTGLGRAARAGTVPGHSSGLPGGSAGARAATEAARWIVPWRCCPYRVY